MGIEATDSCVATNGPTGFASTHWTVVLEAARQDSPAGQAALGTLCQTYWRPVFAFIRRSGYSPDDAEDLTQEFFARLVEKNWLTSITREGGRFRSVLLTAAKHFLAHAREHAQAQKRGSGQVLLSLDDDSRHRLFAEPVDAATPERLFDQRWALGILENTMGRLRQEYARTERGEVFDELKVFLSGSSRPVPHAEIAAKCGISVGAVGVAVHRLRRRYGEILRQQVARTVKDAEDIDEEIRYLIAVLGR